MKIFKSILIIDKFKKILNLIVFQQKVRTVTVAQRHNLVPQRKSVKNQRTEQYLQGLSLITQ